MQTSSGNPSDSDELASFEGWLVRSLYRFDCPDAHTLGEYDLDLLTPDQRVSIAQHVNACDACAEELATLRAFMAAPLTPAAVPESLVQRVRRLLAIPLGTTPGLAFGGMRGSAAASARTYRADGVTITIAPGAEAGALMGLVVAEATDSDALDGRRVRLVPDDGAATTVQLDDLGNFEVQGLAAGEYVLEVDLPSGVVVVEALRVD